MRRCRATLSTSGARASDGGPSPTSWAASAPCASAASPATRARASRRLCCWKAGSGPSARRSVA
eukprot:6868403-Lingulodinium_polyedra.AAC.1